MKLFRKVLTKDRLPAKGGNYDTSQGFLAFLPSIRSWCYGGRLMVETPEYWFEPINLPTDKEIEKAYSEITPDGYVEYDEGRGFKMFSRGAKTALKYMEGK